MLEEGGAQGRRRRRRQQMLVFFFMSVQRVFARMHGTWTYPIIAVYLPGAAWTATAFQPMSARRSVMRMFAIQLCTGS